MSETEFATGKPSFVGEAGIEMKVKDAETGELIESERFGLCQKRTPARSFPAIPATVSRACTTNRFPFEPVVANVLNHLRDDIGKGRLALCKPPVFSINSRWVFIRSRQWRST